jgi:putative colanic acid biosynthesis acetyltransferase WcaF
MYKPNLQSIQNLMQFKLPHNYRGRSILIVQFWLLIQSSFFRWSPQAFYFFRRWLLRSFGAHVGVGVLIRPTATVTYPWNVEINDYAWVGDNVVLYSHGKIKIGKNAVVSQRSYLCTASHDYTKDNFEIYSSPIVIDEDAWLATDVFVAPGVNIGRGCVVGARSSVFSDLPKMMVCMGSPARPIKPRIIKTDLKF